MRANEFITENNDFKDEFWLEYYDQIVTVVTNVWKRKYSDVKLHAMDDEDGLAEGFTFNTNPDHQGYAPGNDGFTLSFGCQLYHTEDGISSKNLFYIQVRNAYSGKYKGVVLDMLDATYKFMESKLQDNSPGSNRSEFKSMIGIHHNRNLEA